MKKAEFIRSLISILPNSDWSVSTMMQVSKNLGLDPNYYLVIFKDNISEIMDYYDSLLDEQMQDSLKSLKTPSKIREKIANAISIRLRLDIGQNRFLRLKSAWRTCDAIWRYAGDNSLDFNYYTKRSLLVGVYIASFRFYKNDNSLDSKDTEEFIKSSLDKVIKIFSIKSKLPKIEDIPILRLFS